MINFIKRKIVFFGFLFLFVIIAFLYPEKISKYPTFVDWHTIAALTGLIVITTGIKESGIFILVSKKILFKLHNERNLTFFLLLFSAVLSTFLTNDITLFIVVPLTIGLGKIIKNDISKLIIFEAISVNVGSLLTPIGNPQNLFLWHKWNIGFVAFVSKMFPLFVILFVFLLIFAWFVFPNKKFHFSNNNINTLQNKRLLYISMLFMIIYIVSLELNFSFFILPVIIVIYIIFYKNVVLKADWLLLIIFIIIFIVFHVLSTLPVILESVNKINLKSSGNVFLFSSLVSQIISNVPAGVFVSKFSTNWFAIAYGINVGGNGLVLSSLANIIALSLAAEKKIWIDFHKYSIPYSIITCIVVYFLFY